MRGVIPAIHSSIYFVWTFIGTDGTKSINIEVVNVHIIREEFSHADIFLVWGHYEFTENTAQVVPFPLLLVHEQIDQSH